MTKFDPGRLIQKTRELTALSRELCYRSHLAVSVSKHLQDRLGIPYQKVTDRARHKRPLKT